MKFISLSALFLVHSSALHLDLKNKVTTQNEEWDGEWEKGKCYGKVLKTDTYTNFKWCKYFCIDEATGPGCCRFLEGADGYGRGTCYLHAPGKIYPGGSWEK